MEMMTKDQYAIFLYSLIGEEIEEDIEIRYQFYGYFQAFMPSGNQVEKVFAALPDGTQLYKRIRKMFLATESQVLEASEQGQIPGYFVPKSQGKCEELQEIGREWLENLIVFAEFVTNRELAEGLRQISSIKVLENEEQISESELQAELLDQFSDWAIENFDDESLISVLDEAYYSINCDYFLSAYLQYPSFRYKPAIDFLEPYFQLWQLGYRFMLTDRELLLLKI